MAGKPRNKAEAYQGLSTRESIVKAAELLCAEVEPEDVKLREIGRRVGIDVSSIYNHFRNREAVLAEVVDGLMRELLDVYSTIGHVTPSEKLRQVCTKQAVVFARRRNVSRLLLRDFARAEGVAAVTENNPLARELYEREVAIIEEGIRTGEFKNVDPQTVIMAKLGITITLIQTKERPCGETNKKTDVIFQGIGAVVADYTLNYISK